MSEIKKYIEDYYLQNRQSPSTTKIAEAVGIARGTAYKYLVEMAEKNMTVSYTHLDVYKRQTWLCADTGKMGIYETSEHRTG